MKEENSETPKRYFYALKDIRGRWYCESIMGSWTDDLSKAALMDSPDNWSPRKGDRISCIVATLREEGVR